MPLCSSTESGKKDKMSTENCQIYKFFTNITKSFYLYICRFVKIPAIEKKLQKQTEKQVKKEADDELVLDVEKSGGGRTTQRLTKWSAIIACDSIQAASFQMKGTLKECKSKKEDIQEKPNIERKPIVKMW